ncbi:hypothetical protein HK105_204945 [Polyrhizophydium stewartii]|uniref:Uncharacterized protein n=1 Tax=Polyrhizophydium stewartii TaxID=2732419 RepID=A0ABR4N7N6_9FUNG
MTISPAPALSALVPEALSALDRPQAQAPQAAAPADPPHSAARRARRAARRAGSPLAAAQRRERLDRLENEVLAVICGSLADTNDRPQDSSLRDSMLIFATLFGSLCTRSALTYPFAVKCRRQICGPMLVGAHEHVRMASFGPIRWSGLVLQTACSTAGWFLARNLPVVGWVTARGARQPDTSRTGELLRNAATGGIGFALSLPLFVESVVQSVGGSQLLARRAANSWLASARFMMSSPAAFSAVVLRSASVLGLMFVCGSVYDGVHAAVFHAVKHVAGKVQRPSKRRQHSAESTKAQSRHTSPMRMPPAHAAHAGATGPVVLSVETVDQDPPVLPGTPRPASATPQSGRAHGAGAIWSDGDGTDADPDATADLDTDPAALLEHGAATADAQAPVLDGHLSQGDQQESEPHGSSRDRRSNGGRQRGADPRDQPIVRPPAAAASSISSSPLRRQPSSQAAASDADSHDEPGLVTFYTTISASFFGHLVARAATMPLEGLLVHMVVQQATGAARGAGVGGFWAAAVAGLRSSAGGLAFRMVLQAPHASATAAAVATHGSGPAAGRGAE